MAMANRDVIVVGLGAVGSAALCQLARRGVKGLGMDRFRPPHDRGSSHGETRITRLALGEGPQYVPFVRRSHEIWRELEASTGERLLHQTGGLIFGVPSGRASAHGVEDFLATTIEVAQTNAIEHEVLNASMMAERFPQFRFRGDEKGYFEPGAGYLRPEACVKAELEEARRLGAALHTGEQVLRWQESGQAVAVTTERGRYEAGQVIICAGPWLPAMIAPLRARAQTFRQTLFWFEPDGTPAMFQTERMPVFIRLPDEASKMFYGFPLLGEAGVGLKVAGEQFDQPCHPDILDRDVSLAEQQAMHRLASPHLRLGSKCVRAVACQYTVTPDFNFIIDQLPGSDRIWFASACSGHGFKHSAAVGEALAELAINGESRFDLSRFRLDRFARQ